MTIHANMGADQSELHIPKIHNHDGTTGSGGALSLGVGSLAATQTDIVLGRETAGAGAVEEITCTAAGRALIDDASASAQRVTLGLAIGTDVQAWDAQLDDLAALSVANGNTIVADGANWITVKNNYNGAGAPGVNDDSSAGYGQGSLWYDLAASPDEIYRCTDASIGAAVWLNTSLTLTDLGSMASQNANAVAITGGTIDGTPIGGTTPSTGDFTRASIIGNADERQLIVVGNTAQTTNIFEIRRSDNTVLFSTETNGNTVTRRGITLGGSGVGVSGRIYPYSTDAWTLDPIGKNISFYGYDQTTANNAGFSFVGNTITATTGTSKHVIFNRAFKPTSGTANFNAVTFSNVIDQTGGASGITRSIMIFPTLTSAADFRAIEIGNVGANHYSLLTGTGKIVFGDRLKITGSQDASQLIINANATQTNPLILVNDNLGTELFRIHSPEVTSFYAGVGAGLANTGGGQNIGIGYHALTATTSGAFLTAMGVNCLASNITGQQNTGIGNGCLFLSNASFLTGFGFNALKNITSGSSNVGVGVNAGALTNVGNNTTSNTSVYLGNNTKALANGNANEIVIGDSAIGVGSNTVVLGNDSITQTRLKGKVEFGIVANRMAMLGNTSSIADPTTTDLPTAKDMAIHKNTTTGNVFLAFNDAGVIKKVQLI